jgi:hypothetical protein
MHYGPYRINVGRPTPLREGIIWALDIIRWKKEVENEAKTKAANCTRPSLRMGAIRGRTLKAVRTGNGN